MPRATVLVLTDRPGEWELAEAWVQRWRERMVICPDEPDGCLCCVAWWDVEAPQEALDELPSSFLASSEWAAGGTRNDDPEDAR
jgi:hypothetical protein